MTVSSERYLVQSAPAAMIRFALGSACTIATLLCIPDGVAILPKTPNLGVWLIRIVGLWLSAYCLWAFGFSCILFVMRGLSRGIEITADGFKLWRFGKLVPWTNVRALSCEPQPFFARAFCLPTVFRLTIYSAKDGDMQKLSPHSIPSFQFDPHEFEALIVFVSQRCFDLQPSAPDMVLGDAEVRLPLRENYQRGRTTRIVMSSIIMVSLVTFLGRKAIVNYSFNMGLKEYKQEHYTEAAKFYRTATTFEPTFAPAWDQLARSEYRNYEHKDAEAHWNKALAMKPDYVEAKIGLATLHMLRREYGPARQLLKKAIQLSPTNLAAYMSLADLQIREGQYLSAISVLKQVVERDEANSRARALLARAYLRSGDTKAAEQQLVLRAKLANDAKSDEAFVQLVTSEVDIARGDLTDAQLKLNNLTAPFGRRDLPDDLLLDMISLRTAQGDASGADRLAAAAGKRGIPSDEIENALSAAKWPGGK